MRIISGSARGRRLTGPTGRSTRPTSDRVREALFSMLYSRFGPLDGTRILDLFAGTGALALEAVSRGARRAVLVDRDRQAGDVIAANIATCGMQEQAEVILGEVLAALPRLRVEAPFDLVFLDPPYGLAMIPKVLAGIDEMNLLAPRGIVCAETARGEVLPEEIGTLRKVEQRRYGSTVIHLYHHRESEAEET